MRSLFVAISFGLAGTMAIACSSQDVFFGAADVGAGGSSLDATSVDVSSASSAGGASSSVSSSSALSSSAASSSASGGGMSPCGNNALDMGEACDDGNMVVGDGCSDVCAVEGSFSKCPSNAGGVGFKLVDKLVFTGSTVKIGNITQTLCGGNSASDAIFEVTPAKTGNVLVTLTTDMAFDAPIIGFRGACFQKPLACTDVNPQQGYSAVRGVTANVPVYIIITGSQGSEGGYTLSFTYQ